MKKGFTLIELLVVVGILAVLAIAALVAINPAEAQRKARDSQRLKDLSTMQTAVEQFIADGGSFPGGTVASNAGTEPGRRACDANGWMGIDVCVYLRSLPVDPWNRAGRCTNNAGTQVNCTPRYVFNRSIQGQYKLAVLLESVTNEQYLDTDGGTGTNAGSYVETGNDMTLNLPAI